MHAPLTPTSKEEGDQRMRRRPRRRKSPLLGVVSARRVWRRLDCLNPTSPTGLCRDPHGRWLPTWGPESGTAWGLGGPTHRLWQTLHRREKGRKGRLEHAASHSCCQSGMTYTGQGVPCRVTEHPYYSRWACNGYCSTRGTPPRVTGMDISRWQHQRKSLCLGGRDAAYTANNQSESEGCADATRHSE